MVSAYLMIKTAAGRSADLLTAIEEQEGVHEAHIVAGQYDIIAEVGGENVYDVVHAASTDVRDLEGVVDTRTYICLD
ncbi:Lrp/AsnC ligand binding domain-containing protein [Halomicrobium salinisoli]|uniref:Lrp/AsnC ligand binding domain-containing protein n=1 Tax=Halomicrobium salinisoli TaxID=2878391 RepID=UPI001CF0A280|nr:Lrp/AsnC ligand binding domain-containing protein [Halomicrobium salinisoli]